MLLFLKDTEFCIPASKKSCAIKITVLIEVEDRQEGNTLFFIYLFI